MAPALGVKSDKVLNMFTEPDHVGGADVGRAGEGGSGLYGDGYGGAGGRAAETAAVH
ncbi:hypothetical protein [Streptomyces eurythermus]